MSARGALLEVSNLRVELRTDRGIVRPVRGVDFSLAPDETLGIVGESGCGKSQTALAILGLLPAGGTIDAGRVLFEGRDLTRLDPDALREIRGNRISMIFQEPMTSLNPVYTVGDQIAEPLVTHRGLSHTEALSRARELLDLVGIPDSKMRVSHYPHAFSGGQRQRVMIAMALACRPALLIADEPTTALDVTVQAQILKLIASLQKEMGMAVILISHSLGVVARSSDHVAVMYSGQIAEAAPTEDLFACPRHPYTRALLQSSLRMDVSRGERLKVIEGSVPGPYEAISGCRFHPRCPQCFEKCPTKEPPPIRVADGHSVRCWLYKN